MKRTTLFLAILCGVYCGYKLGAWNSVSSSRETFQKETSLPSVGRQDDVTPRKDHPKNTPSSSKKTEASLLANISSSDSRIQLKYEKLKSFFPSNEVGRSLAFSAILAPFHGSSGVENQTLEQQIKSLQLYPQEAVQAIIESVGRLPEEYAAEKQFLIQLSTQLECDPKMREDFLVREISRPTSKKQEDKSDLNFLSPLIALDSLILVTPNSELIPLAKTALRMQTNLELKEILANKLKGIDPNFSD